MIPVNTCVGRSVLLVFASILSVMASDSRLVSAHAQLERSTPISGTPLDELPATISLAFTEPVVPASASFSLVGPDGAAVPLGAPELSADGQPAEIPVSANRADAGTYSLRWAVTSATDGHDSSGLIVFSVGTGRAPPEAFLSSSTRAGWWEIAAEAALLLGLAIIAAMLMLRATTGEPAQILFAAIAGAVVFVAAWLTSLEPDRWFPESQAGQLRLVAGGLGVAAAVATALRSRAGAALGWLGWIGAVVAISASGHAAGTDRPWLTGTVTTVHTAIALAWSSAAIAISVQARTGNPRSLIRRLYQTGFAGLALLVVAGVASAALLLPGDRAVTTSLYGRTLLVKLLLVILVLAGAATNHWVVLPWLRRRDTADGQSRLILATEAGALAVTIIIAATLAGTSPPADTSLINVAPRAAAIDMNASAGELRVHLSSQIAGTPEDELAISVADSTGAVPAEIQRVIVVTTWRQDAGAPAETGERFDATAAPDIPGRFVFPAVHLGRTGLWELEVIVRRSGVTDVSSRFEIDSASWQRATPRLVSESWRWPAIPGSAIILIGIALLAPAIAIGAIRRQGPLAPLSGGIIMLAVAMIATGFGIQALQRTSARTAGHELTMPSSADPVASGPSWATYCLACHGASGRGIDSPDPLHQHGSRADLTDRASSQLSDGDLYWLIDNGIGNTQMPAYSEALTEQERWDLVAYIRQLQEGGE